jgi:serine/threonine protein kinase
MYSKSSPSISPGGIKSPSPPTRKARNNSQHAKKPISFADLEYDDKIKTISRRKQGKTITVLGQYQLCEKVGKGAFGIVYKALQLDTGNWVAIKRMKKEGIDEKMLLNLKAEIELLKTLDHQHIVKYLGLIDSDNHINMILEFIESGSLLQMITKYGVLPESLAALYTGQVLKGLIYLHEKNVIHRDIKASNILITADGVVKLADFGIATTGDGNGDPDVNGSGDQLAESSFVEGSPFWMAPEVIQLDTPTTACDIWSLGCTILELVTGTPPYFEMPAMSALFKMVQDECPPIPDHLSEGLQDFLRCCFKKDPAERASAMQLANHSWIKNVINLHELSLCDAQSTVRMHNKQGSDSGSSSGRDSSTNGKDGPPRASLRSIDWNQMLASDSDRDSTGLDSSMLEVLSVSLGSDEAKRSVSDMASKFEDLSVKESVSYVIIITGFETRKNKMFSYTVFRLKVCLGKETWRVYKTYTDFKDLHGQLRARLRRQKKKAAELPKLPGTKMFGTDKIEFVKKRKVKLQNYINELIKHPDVMRTGILTNFLKTNGHDAQSREHQGSELADDEAFDGKLARTLRSSMRQKEKKIKKDIGTLEWSVDGETAEEDGVENVTE